MYVLCIHILVETVMLAFQQINKKITAQINSIPQCSCPKIFAQYCTSVHIHEIWRSVGLHMAGYSSLMKVVIFLRLETRDITSFNVCECLSFEFHWQCSFSEFRLLRRWRPDPRTAFLYTVAASPSCQCVANMVTRTSAFFQILLLFQNIFCSCFLRCYQKIPLHYLCCYFFV